MRHPSPTPSSLTSVFRKQDRIWGCLSLGQFVYLGVPVLSSFLILVGIPPAWHLDALKVGLSLFVLLVSGSLAIRWQERLCGHWLWLWLCYHWRPKQRRRPQSIPTAPNGRPK